MVKRLHHEAVRVARRDTPRLLRRLQAEGNPLGWFLHAVWDRRRDRPMWCAQEAVRSAKERADAVLYLCGASSSWVTGAILPLDGGRHLTTNRPA